MRQPSYCCKKLVVLRGEAHVVARVVEYLIAQSLLNHAPTLENENAMRQ